MIINYYFPLLFDWPILPETAHAQKVGTANVLTTVEPK